MAKSVTLKKRTNGGYQTADGTYRVFNYMGVWTVCFDDKYGAEDMADFMTLAEAREFIAEQVA